MSQLSIAIVTWNRSKQLREALESCHACELPKETEFVIIDNASTDNTESIVTSFFNEFSYDYYYEKMAENLGVGKGRNYAFLKSHGKYVYFLDDDAFIDNNSHDFFLRAINYLEDYPQIATLTTQIYDLVWRANRVISKGPLYKPGLYSIYMFCGGSHFLRRSFWGEDEPYFPNKYGYEEILPSLRVADKGMKNIFAEDLLVIHNPLIDKWNKKNDDNAQILLRGFVSQRIMKSNLYPRFFYPIIVLIFWCRLTKHLSFNRRKIAKKMISSMELEYDYSKRIKAKTVFKLFRDYGVSIF